MTNEDTLFELAILDEWQRQFPTTDKNEKLAQKMYRERLAVELLPFNRKNGRKSHVSSSPAAVFFWLKPSLPPKAKGALWRSDL